jgi:hypothetical protein
MSGFGRLTRGMARRALAGAAIAALATSITVTGCGPAAHRTSSGDPVQSGNVPPPVPTPLAPIADYRTAVTAALHDHLRVWIEADMVKRWEEGRKWFSRAIARVSVLANRPGVVGIKIADELGYRDGMDSQAKITRFLTATARALRARAPHKLILVDMTVPQLGCIPGHQPAGSPEAACAHQAAVSYPQLTLPAIDSYLRLRAIDVLDLSTGLLTDSEYRGWGTTANEAQTAAWREVRRRSWGGLVLLQARKALAHPGAYQGTAADAASDVHLYVDIPLAGGATAVDIWTWRQEYEGAMYRLMNPGLQDNALWKQLERRQRAGDVLFTHMSPHSVERGLATDMAELATVFTDVFLPAGAG